MRKGFTLVELIAVIVVLAIILAITVPGITGIIRSSTMGAVESDAKLVLDAIRIKRVADDNFNPTAVNELTIENLLGLSNENYSNLEIQINEGNTYIKLTGQGKWAGFSACGTFFNLQVNEGDCYLDFNPPTIVLLGDSSVTIQVGSTYIDAGATATDDIDGDITDRIVVTGVVNPNVVGTYVMNYDVSDNAGHLAISVTRTVNVIDTNNPVVTFGTNGYSQWVKTGSTTVAVSDAGGVNDSSLKYQWTTSTTEPTAESFTSTFTNGATINNPAGVTGGYYLWVIASDNQNNTTIARTNVFNLDNTLPVITLNGSGIVNVNKGSLYSDAGANANDAHSGINGNVTATGTVNVNVVGTYTITYNVSDNAGNVATQITRTVNVIYQYYSSTEGVNKPQLATGMTPVKWNGSSWVATTVADADWYNYTSSDKKWANVQTADGSMWVWIPRYIYKISSGWHSSTAATIDIQFSMDTDDTRNGTVTLDTGTTSNASNNKWTNHPAFTFGSVHLSGIWVAKFDPSVEGTSCYSSGTNCDLTNLVPKFIPNKISWANATIDTQFIVGRSLETNSVYGWGTSGVGIDTHMMKNVEWGAALYLATSTYGINSDIGMSNCSNRLTGAGGGSGAGVIVDPAECNAYNTTSGMMSSTTGNIYGIYDMAGGARKHIAAYVNTSGIGSSSIGSADEKYKDIYPITTDNQSTNYSNSINKKGDAIYETSTSGVYPSSTAWYSDYSMMPYSTGAFFYRAGLAGHSVNEGAYSFQTTGNSIDGMSWRAVLLVADNI